MVGQAEKEVVVSALGEIRKAVLGEIQEARVEEKGNTARLGSPGIPQEITVEKEVCHHPRLLFRTLAGGGQPRGTVKGNPYLWGRARPVDSEVTRGGSVRRPTHLEPRRGCTTGHAKYVSRGDIPRSYVPAR